MFPNGLFQRLAENRLAALCTTAAVVAARILGDVASPAFSIDFGNDTSDWARDGECDDSRFDGDGMVAGLTFRDPAHPPRFGLRTSGTGRDYRLGYGLGVLNAGGLRFELGGASNGVVGRATLGW